MTQGTLFTAGGGHDGLTGPGKPLQRLLCARPECNLPVDPRKRGGEPKLYCSMVCQQQHWRETHPRVSVRKRDKLTRAEKILVRLRQGKATGLELLQAGGGTRYGARLKELRDDGYRIVTETKGEWPTYRLEE